MLLKLLLEVDVDGRLWAGRRALQKDLFRRNRPAPCEFGQVAGFTHEASLQELSDPPVFVSLPAVPLGTQLLGQAADLVLADLVVSITRSSAVGSMLTPPKLERVPTWGSA